MGRPRGAWDDRGQAIPLLAVVLVVVFVVLLGVVRVSAVVADRGRARAAADAAALAGVREGRAGAERLAAANDAIVVSFVARGPTVEVRVRAGDAEASARASSEVTGGDGAPRVEDGRHGGVP